MFPGVEAVRMDVRFGMKDKVKQFEWKTPSSCTLPPTVAVATNTKECMIVKILGSKVKCATRGSAMKEIVSWTFPFEQEEEKKRSVILRWCPESDSIAVSIDNVVRILSIVSTSQNDVKLSEYYLSNLLQNQTLQQKIMRHVKTEHHPIDEQKKKFRMQQFSQIIESFPKKITTVA